MELALKASTNLPMIDESCICFLQWALPRLYMHWPGFKKVRGQMCKRLGLISWLPGQTIYRREK